MYSHTERHGRSLLFLIATLSNCLILVFTPKYIDLYENIKHLLLINALRPLSGVSIVILVCCSEFGYYYLALIS